MEVSDQSTVARDEYLNLLVTQLRHQDPLEPTKQEDFLAQLAQFSTVEGIEKLNHSMEGFLEAQTEALSGGAGSGTVIQQIASASNLVGKQVGYTTLDGEQATGEVDSVVINDDAVSLRVGDELVAIDQLSVIRSAE